MDVDKMKWKSLSIVFLLLFPQFTEVIDHGNGKDTTTNEWMVNYFCTFNAFGYTGSIKCFSFLCFVAQFYDIEISRSTVRLMQKLCLFKQWNKHQVH